MMSESKEASESKKPTPNPTATKRERLQVDPEEFVLRKRLPSRFPSRPNDVYVNNRTNFKAQLARCFRCLETDDIVFIHGLGAAVTKAINLALQLQQKASVPLGISVNTSTVKLIDDFEPILDAGAFHTQERRNSAVHIKVFKTVGLKSESL